MFRLAQGGQHLHVARLELVGVVEQLDRLVVLLLFQGGEASVGKTLEIGRFLGLRILFGFFGCRGRFVGAAPPAPSSGW